MGGVKKDITKVGRMFDDEYRVESSPGIAKLIVNYANVRAEADRSNFAAIDTLIDLDEAIAHAPLSERERDVATRLQRWPVDEVAAELGISDSAVRSHFNRACEKIAAHMRGNDYEVEHDV